MTEERYDGGSSEKNLAIAYQQESPSVPTVKPVFSGNDGIRGHNADEKNNIDGKNEGTVINSFRTIFSTSNLSIIAASFALATIGYRYMKWTAFQNMRDDCRVMVTSGQYVSDQCARMLLGPMAPLPNRTTSTTGNVSCTTYDEGLFRQYISSNIDTRPPRLWQFLLFPNGEQPHKSLLCYSMALLPLRLMLCFIPHILDRQTLNINLNSFLHFLAWLTVYYAISLTGIGVKVAQGIFYLLQWSFYETHYVDLPESSWKYLAAYDTVMITSLVTMMWMIFQSDGEYFQYSSVKIRMNIIRILLVYVFPVVGVIRLVPGILTSGFNILVSVIVKIAMYLYIVLSVNVFDERCTASPLKKAALFLVVLVAFAAFQYTDEWLTDIYMMWKNQYANDFWGRHFCQIRNDGGDLTYFKALVEEVFGREKERITLDVNWMRKIYQHPVVGKEKNPELWSRIKGYTMRVMNADNPDSTWIREKL